MRRRFISLILLLCMVWLAATVGQGAGVFRDVRASDWFYEGVRFAYENGLMNGVGGSEFNPQGTTTRAMIVTILHRMEGEPAPERSCPFRDVAAGAWYADSVTWAAENGIVNGYNSTQFGPADNITREQMATILYRYALYKGYDAKGAANLKKYEDYGKISAFAREALAWANDAGLINGVTTSTLEPKGKATRAQTAVILSRFCQSYDCLEETDGKKPGEQKPEQEEQPNPTYNGVEAGEADPNAKNLFLLSAETVGDTVEVTLNLSGTVELCGFDLQLLYDETLFDLQELDTDCDLAVYASASEGCISFNYANAKNITKPKNVLKATFLIVGQPKEHTAFSLGAVEVNQVDSNYNVVAAEYTLTYCKVTGG